MREHGVQQAIGVGRLVEKRIRTERHALSTVLLACGVGEHDHSRCGGADRAQRTQQVQAARPWKVDIDHQHIRRTASDERQCGVDIGCFPYLVNLTAFAQQQRDAIANCTRIVDEQYLHFVSLRTGVRIDDQTMARIPIGLLEVSCRRSSYSTSPPRMA